MRRMCTKKGLIQIFKVELRELTCRSYEVLPRSPEEMSLQNICKLRPCYFQLLLLPATELG